MTEKPDWVKNAPEIKKKIPGEKAKKIIDRDKEIMSPSYTRSEPLVGEEGWGVYVRDVDGNVFLDLSSGMFVMNYGYSNPKIVKAVQNQANKLTHFAGTDFYYESQVSLAEKLAEMSPGETKKRVFYANSGAEAVEAAFKCARWHTRRPRMIAYKGAFHGRTFGAMSLSASSSQHQKHFAPLVPGTSFMPYPYCYRCPFGEEYPGCDFSCVEYIRDSLAKDTPPEDVAAVITEPIQGNGGYITPPPEYYPMIKEMCEEHDWLFIADEIQTGLGRSGKDFAMEYWDIEPDILCTAKALGGGFVPMGAIVAKEEVMDWEPGTHASTFGGNILGCTAALAGLELLENENLTEKAKELGEFARKRLSEMEEEFELIGDVRGKGLLIGIELIKDEKTKERAVEEQKELIKTAIDKGLIIFPGGRSVIRLAPSLTIEKEELSKGLDIFEESIAEVD
ncbi:MAG: acetyl ornithine aminotransferase family protein [Hadesarchaea archaeon]|nr:acetyl ornithine aminotransferase family protein [Hadesarchaea archaeon]